ncbi:hypothetical protein AB1Y20_010463 [Prymnesium parvum]|uniref:aspartate carbamoyltransferase n=1 Tax=Prymnesium parvum TaxID=97485 RepID=A0AB34ISB7_PRYPA
MSGFKRPREAMASLTGMDIVSVEQFDEGMLRLVFDTASEMKRMVRTRKKSDLLRGHILANVFFEPSTRTMCSFDAAMKRLGGEVISVFESSSSSKKGESIEDTIRCLECYCDVLVLRHPEKGTAAKAAAASKKPLINAGDGVGEHPTQALLDLFTLFSNHPSTTDDLVLDGLNLLLLGDLKHGRTVHSLSLLTSKLSRPPRLTLVSPEVLRMPASVTDVLRSRGLKLEETAKLEEALPGADVLYVTRVQRERFASADEYDAVKGAYTIDAAIMRTAKSDMIVMHPLPRVDEISTDFDADPRAQYFDQMENGMYVRMALLALVLGADLSKL